MSRCNVCNAVAGAVDYCEECYEPLCPDCVEKHNCENDVLRDQALTDTYTIENMRSEREEVIKRLKRATWDWAGAHCIVKQIDDILEFLGEEKTYGKRPKP